MSKHTPGPWVVGMSISGLGISHRIRTDGNGMESIASVGNHDINASDGHYRQSVIENTQIHANARLIAAAPDMVDVLTELDEFQKRYEVASFGDKMPGNELYSGLLMAIVTKARTALAKAHGETQ